MAGTGPAPRPGARPRSTHVPSHRGLPAFLPPSRSHSHVTLPLLGRDLVAVLTLPSLGGEDGPPRAGPSQPTGERLRPVRSSRQGSAEGQRPRAIGRPHGLAGRGGRAERGKAG